MRELFRLFSVRHLRAHGLRALLGVVAVALGVALYVASHVTTASVRNSMTETARSLAGRAQWRVSRGSALGVEESLTERIRALPGAIASPLIQANALVVQPRGGTLLLLGIDFASDSLLRLYRFPGKVDPTAFLATAFLPDGIVVTTTFAKANHLTIGSSLTLSTRHGLRGLHVTGMLDDTGPAGVLGGNFAVMELHAAQRLFGRAGMVDRIEVAGVSKEHLQQACPGYPVSSAVHTSSTIEDALARIDSLVALSVIALLVGLFIIYNTIQVSVVERLKEIGTLRALGATRRQILGMLLLEGLTVGALGSAAGLGLGVALARGLLQFTARNMKVTIPLIDIRYVTIPPLTLALAFLLGIGATLVATWLPARAATHFPTVEILRPYTYRLLQHNRRSFRVGLACLAGGAGTVFLISISPVMGLAATGLVFLGLALLLPELVLRLARASRRLLQRMFGIVGFLAADNIVKFPQRTALTVVTLGGALAMMVASATVLEGFRAATSRWMKEALRFDLAVSSTDFITSMTSGQTMPASVKDAITRLPGVNLTYGIRYEFAEFRGAEVMVVGVEMRPFLELQRQRGMSAWAHALNEPAGLRKVLAGEGVYVSENFAAIFGIRQGERIDLATASGPRSFPVIRSIEDYSWPHGVIVLDLHAFQRLWHDDTLTYVDIAVTPQASVEEVRTRILRDLSGKYSLFVYDRKQIQRTADEILTQSIAVADVQVIIAIAIGFLGIVNSLLISVLQRNREIGLLRAIGMPRRQLSRTIVLEGMVIAVVGGMVGLTAGLLGGWLPLRAYSFTVTGYLYPIVVPWKHGLLSLLTALAIGFLASLLPARRAATLNVIESIGYE